jgi:gliding motility-associated lipoprotein GldH
MYRLTLLIIVIVLAACTSKPNIQSKYQGFENQSWGKNSPIEFTYEISDTSLQYSLNASLRYNRTFSFNALNMSVSLISPSGSSRFQGIALDVKNKNGSYKGIDKSNYLELEFVIFNKIRFNEKGEWTLNVTHKMPIDISRGLIGLEFTLKPLE